MIGRGVLAPRRHRDFDPRKVGTAERDAWVAYYEHKWLRLLRSSVQLVHWAFRMRPRATLRGAWHVLRANQLWAPVPDNDVEGARRHMERFYAIFRQETGELIDPAVAARLEVEWWRIHRSLQRDPAGTGSTVAELSDALSKLYAYVYRVEESVLAIAAQERAAAMVTSDTWVAAGCPGASPLLADEGAALVRSYAALLAAVHR
jgi:hypothetical protein